MRLVTGACLTLIVAADLGCAARHPLVVWQEHLTEYVEEQGNGDPNVLRDTVDLRSRRSPRPGRITFAALGIRGPGPFPFAETWDVQGVLVEPVEVDAGRWFLFVVGVLKQYPRRSAGLEDVRLAAFTADRTGLRWRIGEPDAKALSQYLTAVGRRGSSAGVYADHPAFPGPGDVFQLDVVEHMAFVREPQSGAQWELHLGTEERRSRDSRATGRQMAKPTSRDPRTESDLPRGKGGR